MSFDSRYILVICLFVQYQLLPVDIREAASRMQDAGKLGRNPMVGRSSHLLSRAGSHAGGTGSECSLNLASVAAYSAGIINYGKKN